MRGIDASNAACRREFYTGDRMLIVGHRFGPGRLLQFGITGSALVALVITWGRLRRIT